MDRRVSEGSPFPRGANWDGKGVNFSLFSANATKVEVCLFDAAGCDVIMVETVGVGQDEVEIAKLADVTLVVLTPNAGDDVQALKAGIMEIADVFILNKSDLAGADKLDRELKASFTLSHRPDGWTPLVVRTIAAEAQGIDEALAATREYHSTGLCQRRRGDIWTVRLREMLRERLLERYDPTVFEQAAKAVISHKTDPYTVIEELLSNGS